MKYIWDSSFEGLLEGYTPKIKAEWFHRLVNNINVKLEEREKLPFKITEIKDGGFEVKVEGLFAFIPFEFMPWKYPNIKNWKVVFPHLLETTLICRIFKIEPEPLYIKLNARIPQFEKPVLLKGEKYKGIVLYRGKDYLLVDFGIHFNWECGSVLAYMIKSQFDSKTYFGLKNGSIIEAVFARISRSGNYIFKSENIPANIVELSEKYLGKTVEVKVVIEPGKAPDYTVDKIKASFCKLSKFTFISRNRNEIKQAINNLLNGDVIHCMVTGINADHTIRIRWDDNDEISKALLRGNNLPLNEVS